MLQYLINTSMIWLLSLLVFDIFLRKESYHSYNRLYLLLTFLLGLLLPMLQWQNTDVIYSIGAAKPIANVIATKHTVVQATTIEPTHTIDWIQWLWIAYYTGVVISAILFIKEMVVLARYFRSGTKTKDGVWNIVETGRQHSPFSVFRHIFIGNKSNYSPAELHMILKHEKQHGLSLHCIDMLIMEIAKIVLWFHPLVYLFQKRLLTLHEYQADAAIQTELNEYGRFLIQQSMLQTAPSLSHSFNRSPIKNRIVMLTRTSSFKAGFKRLVAIPLCIVCVFLFTEYANSKDNGTKGNKMHYNGNEFDLQYTKGFPFYALDSPAYKLLAITGLPDTIYAQNPRTGTIEKIAAQIDTIPTRMNGKDIYRVYDLAQADSVKYRSTTGLEMKNFLLDNVSAITKDAPDGYYGIFQYMVLDDNGNIAYVQQPRQRGDSKYEVAAAKVEAELFKAIKNSSKKFTPIKRGGKAEVMRVPAHILEIQNGKISISVQSQYGC